MHKLSTDQCECRHNRRTFKTSYLDLLSHFIILYHFFICYVYIRAPSNKTRLNLSSKLSFRLLHSIRARNDGVLIGINTLFCDQPQLNIRDQLEGSELPYATTRPIVIDSTLKFLSLNPSYFRLIKPIVACTLSVNDPLYTLAQSKLAEIGGSIISCKKEAGSDRLVSYGVVLY